MSILNYPAGDSSSKDSVMTQACPHAPGFPAGQALPTKLAFESELVLIAFLVWPVLILLLHKCGA